MKPYYDKGGVTLHNGDCREVMATFEENSIDAIVTDPPYGIGFMGREWDNFKADIVNANAERRGRQKPIPAGGRNGHRPRARTAPAWEAGRYDTSMTGNQAFQLWCEQWAAEALRVLKPGSHAVVFGSPRTYHRLASGLEDAGFEIRDCLQWLFGSGFPKSLNLHGEWEGWGTALKPAYEPVVLARKPLIGTVAANVTAWGTGGLNIDATRIGEADTRNLKKGGANDFPHEDDSWQPRDVLVGSASGRWPANVLLDAEAAAQLDAMSGATVSRQGEPRAGANGNGWGLTATGAEYNDRGGASRYFYTAKTSRAEREFGLDDLEPVRRSDGREKDIENPRLRTNERRNDHPTVKPVDLMRWLCRLITPPGGVILDPFLGSGSTGMAALDEGFRFVGIDLEPHYIEIARRRIARRHVLEPLPQRDEGQAVLL